MNEFKELIDRIRKAKIGEVIEFGPVNLTDREHVFINEIFQLKGQNDLLQKEVDRYVNDTMEWMKITKALKAEKEQLKEIIQKYETRALNSRDNV